VKKGIKVSATKIVEEPLTVVSRQQKLTGKMPMVATIPSDQTLLIASGAPSSASAAGPSAAGGEQAPTKLPKTGSNLPVLALLGFVSLSLALVSRIIRSRA
jgi:LPXTG-motif cell wall-anchored protein